MRVHDVHERWLPGTRASVGALIDSLGSDDDRLWPHDEWVAMRFDRPLGVGASGGHGFVRYEVVDYDAGRLVRFRYRRPRGLVGEHRFETEPGAGDGRTVMRHVVEAETHGLMSLFWPWGAKPVHDAMIEDALDRAEAHLGGTPRARRRSLWVRFSRLNPALRPSR